MPPDYEPPEYDQASEHRKVGGALIFGFFAGVLSALFVVKIWSVLF